MPGTAVTVTPLFTNELTWENFCLNIPKTGTFTLPTDALEGFTSIRICDHAGPDEIYESNCAGYLTLTAPTGKTMNVSGTATTESIQYDWLTIYNGKDQTAPVLGNEKYGSTSGEDLGTLNGGKYLTFYFKSDGSQQYAGVDLIVTFSNAVSRTITVVPGEGGTVTAPATAYCGDEVVLDVTASEGKSLTSFTVNGVSYTVKWYEQPYFVMPDENVTIVPTFGDKSTLNVLNIPSTGTVNAKLASGITSFKVQDEAGDGDYENNWTGTLVLTAPDGWKVNIEGTCFTEGTTWDYLILYDGPSSSSPTLGRAVYGNSSGESTVIAPVTSSSNVVTFYFRSDVSTVQAGVDLNVKVFPDVDENSTFETADVEALADMVAGSRPKNKAADVNFDKNVSVGDIPTLIEILKE